MLPGREAKTRESKPFTWTEIIKIGLGELRMSPADLYACTMQEFMYKLEGTREFEYELSKERWEIARAIVFDNAVMQGKELKDKKPSIYKYWPLPWDQRKGIAAIADPKSRVDAIMELRKKYLKAAKASKNKNGEGTKNNHRG